jgi:hypothetical protein
LEQPPAFGNRVVQKLQFLNNNRLKTAKNMDFVGKSAFFGRLERPDSRTSPISIEGAMKKFFFSFIIILALAALAFFAGWAQLAVPPGSVGVMRSKTHGLDAELIQEGEFRWVWFKLIPTNVTISVFRLDERRYSLSIKNTLPSAGVYSAFMGITNDFSYELSASLFYSLDEKFLISLIKEHSIDGQDKLDAFEEDISGKIQTFVQGRLSSGSDYTDDLEEILASGRSPALEKDIQTAFPYIKNVSCLITAAVFPDFALYRQIRGFYEDYLEKQREYLSSGMNLNAENHINARFRFDELEKYGELLTKYPILIQYLSIEKGQVTPP